MKKNIIAFSLILVLIILGSLIIFIIFDRKKSTEQLNELKIESADPELNVDSDFVDEGSCNSGNDDGLTTCSVDFDNLSEEVDNGKNDIVEQVEAVETTKENKEVEVVEDDNGDEEVKAVEEVENLAYDFELKNLEGEKVRLSDYRGKKPVIVEFWNLWCHNCQREMPKLQKTYEKYDDKFEIIGVNLLPNKGPSDNWDSKKDIRSFIDKHGINFPIVFDKDLSVAKKYKVKATNHHFLINLDGTIYDDFYIDLDDKKLEEFLEFNGV